MIDFHAIRAANPLLAIIAPQVQLRRAGREWKGCCPFHHDKNPSFTVYEDHFHCFGCGAHGDVLGFVRKLYSLDLPGAASVLSAGDLPKRDLPPRMHRVDDASRMQEAVAIWDNAVGLTGTPAQTYLAIRGINPPIPSDIRFSRLPYGRFGLFPCLVAAVRDVTGAVTGVQRVYLQGDGRGKADLAKPKLSLGKLAGGAIRLGEPDASGEVIVCEGPETGLSLVKLTDGAVVWVSVGASMMPAMQFFPEVRSVVIGADNDYAGALGAAKAAKAYVSRGLSVRIIRPLPGFKDFNDELQGSR
jgi:DNA primase